MPRSPESRNVHVRVAPCEAPGAVAADQGRRQASLGKIAVIVAHGMGQQVPFETLELVANAIRKQEEIRHGAQQKTVTRIVKLSSPPIPPDSRERPRDPVQLARAELEVTGADGPQRELHFYEVYWAPLTEGRVQIRDVVSFLLAAGYNGWRNSRAGVFRRWMFQRWVELEKSERSTRHFVIALLVVLSLVFINGVIGAVVTARLVTGGAARWPSAELLHWLTWDMTALAVFAALVFAAVKGLPALAGRFRAPSSADARPARLSKSMHELCWALVWTALCGTVAVALIMVVQMVALRHPDDWPPPRLAWWQDLLMLLPWLIAVGASYAVRWFLVQYVGDVAAYTSAHAVNRFAELREQVGQTSLRVARAVYRAWDETRQAYEYSSLILVGHSLGSVVAYDTLNALLLEDELAISAAHVAERTELLLTFGSPLDKTAFIFRTQKGRDLEIREGLAAAVQPMIVDYAKRPRRWVNLYSPDDWIAGSLEYYDDPRQAEPHRGKFVENVADLDASVPLVAHTMYWSNPKLTEVLYEAVTAPLPANRP